MNKEFLLAHIQSDSDWLSYLAGFMLYDTCICVCRDYADRAYIALHKPKLEI